MDLRWSCSGKSQKAKPRTDLGKLCGAMMGRVALGSSLYRVIRGSVWCRRRRLSLDHSITQE